MPVAYFTAAGSSLLSVNPAYSLLASWSRSGSHPETETGAEAESRHVVGIGRTGCLVAYGYVYTGCLRLPSIG